MPAIPRPLKGETSLVVDWRSWAATLILLAAALLLAAPDAAHGFVVLEEGFECNVIDADTGNALPGVTVRVIRQAVGPVASTTTNSSGWCSFTGDFADATYYIEFDKTDYMFSISPFIPHSGSQHHVVNHDQWPMAHRIWGQNRFSTATEIAKARNHNYPINSWFATDHVIIASGDDRAAADPLAAAGLSWAWNRAPIFLVSAKYTPSEVLTTIADVADKNGGVELEVVGGPVSVPDARLNEIVDYVETKTGQSVKVHRLLSTGSRYDMAAKITQEMKARADSEPGLIWKNRFLVANGTDPDKFFDALALSPVAASAGYPIVLVSENSVPPATENVIKQFTPEHIYVGGGPNTVSESVLTKLGGWDADVLPPDRWWGQNRYATAKDIAMNAPAHGLDWDEMGVAAKLPDALSGGTFLGLYDAPLLLVKKDSVPAETSSFIQALDSQEPCYIFGGPNSVEESVRLEIYDQLKHQ
ncbi:MAG: cell wall-binding repeat-containing protein [Coriobacteriia bacterium]|nr:cell wall-binding repeat-containing protein [Coriobacteriia bacterium]